MKVGEVFAHCASCDAPLLVGMKINEYPCPDHADCYEFYCDTCVEAALARLKAKGIEV